MMNQALRQARPDRGRVAMGPATGRIKGAVPLNAGFTAVGTRPVDGRRSPRASGSTGVITWGQRTPRIPFRRRLVAWRARNWHRVVLAWFVLAMIIMMVAAEPKTDFPKAQIGSVPAVHMFLRVAGGLTMAGVPVLLIALP